MKHTGCGNTTSSMRPYCGTVEVTVDQNAAMKYAILVPKLKCFDFGYGPDYTDGHGGRW